MSLRVTVMYFRLLCLLASLLAILTARCSASYIPMDKNAICHSFGLALVLISDMKGDKDSIDIVIEAHPEVINHNIETVSSLYQAVRPEADYERSIY